MITFTIGPTITFSKVWYRDERTTVRVHALPFLLVELAAKAAAAKAAPAPSQEGILARMERVAGRQEGLSWRERLASSDESLLAKMARVEATLGLSGASQPLVARVAAAQRAVGLPPQGNSLRLQLDAIVAAVEGRR